MRWPPLTLRKYDVSYESTTLQSKRIPSPLSTTFCWLARNILKPLRAPSAASVEQLPIARYRINLRTTGPVGNWNLDPPSWGSLGRQELSETGACKRESRSRPCCRRVACENSSFVGDSVRSVAGIRAIVPVDQFPALDRYLLLLVGAAER